MFEHKSLSALAGLLLRLLREHPGLCAGESSVFVAVESLYSMDGTIAPLAQIVELIESLLPYGNDYLVVVEAHATRVYGPQGKGMVAMLGLERRVLARLHTFGKALAGSGGAFSILISHETDNPLNILKAGILTDEITRDYLLNYAEGRQTTQSKLTEASERHSQCSPRQAGNVIWAV
jgi:8-amino-7-oxononanoate synthase